MSSLKKSASINKFWKQSFTFKTPLSLMTLLQESSHLVTLEKNRFPSGSTVSREELIVFKAPFVLWRREIDDIFCAFKIGGKSFFVLWRMEENHWSLAYSQIIFSSEMELLSVSFWILLSFPLSSRSLAPHEVRDVYRVVSAQGIKVTSALKTSVIWRCHHQYYHRCTVCGEINK